MMKGCVSELAKRVFRCKLVCYQLEQGMRVNSYAMIQPSAAMPERGDIRESKRDEFARQKRL